VELVKQFFQFFIGGIISATNGAKKVATDFAVQTQQLEIFQAAQQASIPGIEQGVLDQVQAEQQRKVLIAYGLDVLMIIIAIVIVWFFIRPSK